jgi:hypothetical protein
MDNSVSQSCFKENIFYIISSIITIIFIITGTILLIIGCACDCSEENKDLLQLNGLIGLELGGLCFLIIFFLFMFDYCYNNNSDCRDCVDTDSSVREVQHKLRYMSKEELIVLNKSVDKQV